MKSNSSQQRATNFLQNQNSVISRSLLVTEPQHSVQDKYKKQNSNSMFLGAQNQSVVYKELIKTPLESEKSKRSIEIHLEDTLTTCSLRDFYRVKEVYSRNMFCSITGVLLEVKDLDLASNFIVSKALSPTSPSAEAQSIDQDNDEDFDERQCAYLLRFNKIDQNTGRSQIFYQRSMPRCHKVIHCSVSDSYIVYAIVQEDDSSVNPLENGEPQLAEFIEDNDDVKIAKQTLIVVIDINKKTEIVLANPSKSKITAVYVDESALMLGSYYMVFQLDPRQLFLSQREPTAFDFSETMLPESSRQNNEIYAFWHTKNASKFEIYVKSNVKAEISIFNLRTEQELLRMQKKKIRDNQKKQSTSINVESLDEGSAPTINEIQLAVVLDLNKEYLKNRVTPRSYSGKGQKHDKHLGTMSSGMVSERNDEEGSHSDENLSREDEDEEQRSGLRQESSDDEGYVSGQSNDQGQEKSDDEMYNDINKNLSGTIKPSDETEQKVYLKRHESFDNKDIFRKHDLNEPFLSKNQSQVKQQQVRGRFDDQVQISKVKFIRRNTIVFRSDGQVDFIGSNQIVYSTRNIDFKKMKWESTNTLQKHRSHQATSPTIKDVVMDEHDLLLISQTGLVYLFSIDRMTVSKTKIKSEQATLFPYQNRLQLFSDFLVYDNVTIISHYNMISICDMNARICREKSWRHIAQPLTDVTAEDRETFNNENTRRDPFRICKINIRMIKLRVKEDLTMPRIMVLFQNNVIRMLALDTDLKWNYDQYNTKLIQGEVNAVICSKKANSLVLLRHKPSIDSPRSALSVFYFGDSVEDLNKWTVLEDLQDHQKVFQISLQGHFMKDSSIQENKPTIGVYDDVLRQLSIYKLEKQQVNDSDKAAQEFTKSQSSSIYGKFRLINKIQNFRMLPTDVIRESGTDTYFFLARQNKIFKCYVSDEAMRKAQNEQFQKQTAKDQKDSQYLVQEHPNLEVIATIASRYSKYTAIIEDFNIMLDNCTTYIYASTKSHIYFNSINQFGKLFSGSKLMTPQLARNSYNFYFDDTYAQLATYGGPFEIIVLPYLSSNRISMRGVHHLLEPIFYQTRGYENLHVLTRDSEIKTWNANTGKLRSCVKLQDGKYEGFKKINYYRNRTVVCRQNTATLDYEYLCLEIVSKRKIIEYASVVSPELINLFVNSQDNLIFTEHRGSKHNVFEIAKFDKQTGEIQDVVRTFNRSIPLNFLSPSFNHYIDIESHTHKIKVLDMLTDRQICVLPQHLYKFMCKKQESFSTENFLQKLIFIDEDFILMELDHSQEIIFHIPSENTISQFNVLSPHLKFNSQFFPVQYNSSLIDADAIDKAVLGSTATPAGLRRQSTSWVSPKEHAKILQSQDNEKIEYIDPIKSKKEMTYENSSAFQFLMLEDLIYMNMKRQRHIHFMEMQSLCTVFRDREINQDGAAGNQLKLISVRPFSYSIWKVMEDLCTEKNITIQQLSREQLVAACFAILPDSQGNRIRQVISQTKDQQVLDIIQQKLKNAPPSAPTLLHKLTLKNPEDIKPLIARMKKDWPSLALPHVFNQEGQTPLKLAHIYRHKRVIGWLLDLLKSYPFGYCQFQVSNMIHEFIGDGFEGKIGDYLNQRFMTQKWTSPYKTGRLQLGETGLNQTTVRNWPSRTENLEEKFFKKECTQVPVMMKIMDCPNLHSFSKEDTQKLLLALTNCDISIYSHRSIQALIEYSWESTQCVIVGLLFFPFLCYLITYMIFLEILFDTKTEDIQFENLRWWERHITQGMLLIFAIYFIQLHIRQIIAHNFQISGALLWSSVDLVPLLANLISISVGIAHRGEVGELIEVQKPIYACATIFLFLKLFYFLRYFREIGHLVRMVFMVMHQMRYFFVVFFCFLFTFASAFYALTGGQMAYTEVSLFVFNITIRKSDTSWFSAGYEALLFTCFVCTSMFFTYIMLNITVSMVKGFYDGNMRIKTESQYQVMTQLTLDCFPYIRAPRSERDLRPPEGTQDYVEEPSYTDQDKSFFQFKLRENSFCNQYLLTVETEQEDKSSLYSSDPDQSIKDLQKQVNQGFQGVQKQLQHQDQVIQNGSGQRGDGNSPSVQSREFQMAVDERVQSKLKEVQDIHAQKIAQLKEGQQQILSLLKKAEQKSINGR